MWPFGLDHWDLEVVAAVGSLAIELCLSSGLGDDTPPPEAIGWDGQNCTLAGGAGISATIDNGRFMSLGGIDGLVVASGLAFDPNGLLTGSVLTGVIGQAHPGP